MSWVLAYAGRYSFSFIKNLFDSGGYLGGIVSTILLIVIIIALIKVDWTRFIDPDLKTED